MGKVILTTDTQHMEAISTAQETYEVSLTHMNDVSLGYRARGEGPVRGCECVRHLNAFDVCEGVSCHSPSDG